MPDDGNLASFHRFPDLPYDLRVLIWQICLPNRVHETDQLFDDKVWTDQGWTEYHDLGWTVPPPCQLWPTQELNNRPPMITKVCREAREIALTANRSSYASRSDLPSRIQTYLQQRFHSMSWFDRGRDSAHLYMEDDYTFLRSGKTPMQDPLGFLAEFTAICKSKSCSFGLQVLEKGAENPAPSDLPQPPADKHQRLVPKPYRIAGLPTWCYQQKWRGSDITQAVAEDVKALEQLKHWQVVFGLVVVHCSSRHAAGRFGLLGDAPIQIVEIEDQARMADLTLFARSCEDQFGTEATQDFVCAEMSPGLARRRLDHVLWMNGYPKHVYQRMHPAIMFRLCTHPCNTHDGCGESVQCSHKCFVPLAYGSHRPY